jgi:CheY-like chemotaxis protein
VSILGTSKDWPKISHQEIVHRSRILVIDDGDFAYMPLFKRDGYTIEQWSDVTDLGALETEKFDLILLDLKGVGIQESADEGFGILRHIRRTSPTQIVIAYSNSDLSLAYQPFFQDADAVLHKTQTDYVEFKRAVDELLDRRFSKGFYVGRVRNELGDLEARAPKAVKKAEKAMLSKNSEGLRRYLVGRIDDAVTIDRVIAVVGAGAQVASLWKS